jgi:hypothetical protein
MPASSSAATMFEVVPDQVDRSRGAPNEDRIATFSTFVPNDPSFSFPTVAL